MNFSSLDDTVIMSLITRAHGDAALNGALGELYDRYGRLVFSVAVHMVGDVETAEEITQDVFLRAWDGAHTYRPEVGKVGSWLVSIARHRSIDELRRRSVRPEKDKIEWAEDSDLENRIPDLHNPEESVEGTQQKTGIRAAIAELPTDQREVLGLAFFRGLSHSEIADLLGEPLGTIKSRIRLGMQKLRGRLGDYGIDGLQ